MRTDVVLDLGLKRRRVAVDERVHDTLESKSRVTRPSVKVCDNQRYPKNNEENSQSGWTLSGEAITIPELAPDAHAPADPMLQSKSLRATGLSVAMNESTDRFKISASRSLTRLGSGRQRTAWMARPPTTQREAKEYMTGWAMIVVRLKGAEGMREETKVEEKRSIVTFISERSS